MACALLEANNIRDIAGDQASGKKTLAARLGRRRASYLYGLFAALTVLGAVAGGAWLVGIVAVVAYLAPLRIAFSPREGRELLVLLKMSARTQLLVGAAAVAFLIVWH